MARVFKIGDEVEGFKIMSEIGRGAASIIYLVQDPRSKQIWALKHVAKGDSKDARFLEQSELEYQVASKLNHPAVRRIERMIKIKDGILSVGELILVMELVDGVSVDKKPPKTFDSAAHIFEQVARGMAYMHASGYVHADMKPNNIIVDEKDNAKIIDLGQSCPMNTVKKRIQGTPDYIAPEQVHRRPITHKTDIYNLGATMYWALTRRFVPTALAKPDSLVGSIDDTLIPRPTPPCELNKRVPQIFSDLIMECVEIEPADRPDTMGVVADRLALVQAKLAAEGQLRRSGSWARVEDENSKSKSGSRAALAADDDSVDLEDISDFKKKK